MLKFIKNIIYNWLFTKFEIFALYHYLVYGEKERLTLSKTCSLNNAIFNVVGGRITIGEYVFFGHNVLLLTGSHDYHQLSSERMAGILEGNDIVVEEGVWIASGAIVIGPSRIGRYSVVAAGAVVKGDVPEYTLVAGVPARVVKSIEAGSNHQDSPDLRR